MSVIPCESLGINLGVVASFMIQKAPCKEIVAAYALKNTESNLNKQKEKKTIATKYDRQDRQSTEILVCDKPVYAQKLRLHFKIFRCPKKIMHNAVW